MPDSLRDRVARAVAWSTDEIDRGYGKWVVRTRGMNLDDIQQHLGRQMAGAQPRYALAVDEADEDPGGPEVSVGKKRAGLFAVTEDAFILTRGAGWGRTVTEAFALEECEAEPVTCHAKGKATAGLRITGSHYRGLLLLDQSAGGGSARQARIRDRIVAAFNGEQQAGPGQRDTHGQVQTALFRLTALPTTTVGDVRNPLLDPGGELVMAEGESLLHRGRYVCGAVRHEPVAFGSSWRTQPAPAAAADVWITSLRVAACCPDWRDDPAAAALADLRRRAGFNDEPGAPVVAVAHLAASWISNIYAGRSAGSLEFAASDRGMSVRLRVIGLEFEQAQHLMHEAASAVASHRLATDETLKPEERQALEPVSRGRATAEQLDWGSGITLPSSFYIGRDPASQAAPA